MDDLASLTALLERGQIAQPAEAANRLLQEFGALGSVLAAEPERLARILELDGVGLIGAAHRITLAALRPFQPGNVEPAIDSTHRLLAYLQAVAGHAQVEEFHVLYLSKRLTLLRHELAARGDRNHLIIDDRELVRRALDLGASGLLVAHNHPSGSLKPSKVDVAVTRKLARSAALFEIRIIDHVIVTREGAVSFAAEGLM